MESPIEEIKSRLNIVEIIKGYIELTPAGRNFKARCPFHGEKTPSFMVSPERQSWHCFGSCNEGGDLFSFVMRYENVEFYEALKLLAERAGVELARVSPQDQREFGVLYDLNAAAAEFYERELAKSSAALTYLASRGVRPETIAEFGIGFAPNSFDALMKHLAGTFEIGDLLRSGVVARSEQGKYFDRFRGRIMFPLRTTFGKVVAFSGRILPEFDTGETAKYLNSPETPIFSKSRLLYGLSQSKRAAREAGKILLVEGQMDVVMAHQDSVRYAVGTSGTALTREQLKTLARITRTIILNFDSDEAGLQAMERSIDLANGFDLEVHALELTVRDPADEARFLKDPADVARAHPGLLATLVAEAVPAMEYFMNRHLVSAKIEERKRGVRFVLGKVRSLTSAVERRHWLSELALRAGVSEGELADEMRRLPVEGTARAAEERPAREGGARPAKLAKKEQIARRLLHLVASYPDFCEGLDGKAEYLPNLEREVYTHLTRGTQPTDGEEARLLDGTLLGADSGDRDLREARDEFDDLLRRLEAERLAERKEEIYARLRVPSGAEEDEEYSALLGEFQEVTRRIEELRSPPPLS